MLVLTVDPGKVSGVGLYRTGHRPQYHEIPYAQTPMTVHAMVCTAQRDGLPVELAVEKYTISTNRVMTPQPEALMCMGALEHIGRLLEVPWFYYTPGASKSVGTDDRLKQLGWYQRTKDGHANDGARLVLVHLAVQHPQVFADLLGL